MKAVEREPWWHERSEFIRSAPPTDGLRRLAVDVLRGSTAVRVRRLGGGIGTATSAVSLRTTTGRRLDVVLKRFPRRDRPGLPANEWKRLVFAQRLPVPTPEPIAFDRGGRWFGVPSIVMSKLPGRPDVDPTDVPRWL